MPIVPIPGASALLAALVAAALPASRFTFFGFLERKGKERSSAIADLAALPHTAVLYESPNRLADTLDELASAGLGERKAAVARELTKQFEAIRRGTVEELARYYADAPPRGEIVIVIAGADRRMPAEDELRAAAAELRAAGASARDVMAALSARGASRNVAYRLAHES